MENEEEDFKITENEINNNSNEIDFKIEDILTSSELQNSLRPTKKSQFTNNEEEGAINLIEFQKKNFILNEEALEILRNIKEEIIIMK